MALDARNGGDGREDGRASSAIETVLERNEGATDRLFVDKETNERGARRLFADKEEFVVDKETNERANFPSVAPALRDERDSGGDERDTPWSESRSRR